MGITIEVAEIIVREHVYRSLEGTVLLLGRQTMLFSPERAIKLIRDCGATPTTDDIVSIQTDKQTLASAGFNYIRDDEFFRLLGISIVRSLDHSDYEGAEIVHDLNKPIPDELEEIADILIDGSTLDNVFNPAMVLMNMNRLIKKNGRIISTNMGTNHNTPYMVPTLPWIFDYFVFNNYNDLKSYFVTYLEDGINVVIPNFKYLNPAVIGISNLNPTQISYIIFVAEKSGDSTWNVAPSQHHYRSAEDWGLFSKRLTKFVASKRAFHIASTAACAISVPEGWTFVEKEWRGQVPSL